MRRYTIRIKPEATDSLERIDRRVAKRIADRIKWLACNVDNIRPEALGGELSGLYKLRVGDYRVLYEIVREKEAIVVHAIGHRSEIYRRPEARMSPCLELSFRTHSKRSTRP